MIGVSYNLISMQAHMNLNIENLLPEPPSITHPNLFAVLTLAQPTLLLYAPPLPPEKPEEPKKKFAFKAPAQPVNTVEPVHLLDLSTRKWTTQQTRGKFPSRRENPAFACIGPCLMVYGGTQISPNKQLNDLYCLNLETWQWKKLFTMQAPPAHPHPIAVSHQDKLIIITNQTWIFNTKGVNWNAEATDLPGGVWQRLPECELLFTPQCAFNEAGSIIVLGGPKLSAASINIEERKIQPLAIEGQPQGQQKSIQVCATSEGRALLIDSHIFCSIIVLEQSVYLGQWTQSQDNIQRIVFNNSPIHTANYGLNSKKQMVSVELTLNKAEEEPQEQQNTARHIEKEDEILRHSSILERQSYEERSSRPLPSPLSEGLTNPIVTRLSSLLAREWLRRRVLEQKGKLLQDTIKKAEKMVLALCRYGDEQEKQMHIARVCRIRQSLCKVLQQQSFVRKEMDDRPGQKQLRSRALRQEQGLSCFDANYL